MKTATKIVIFLVTAFIIVIIVALATRTAVAPVVAPLSSTTPVAEKTYTLAQVGEHKTPTDCWTTVKGGVYNLTPFINQHPGGVPNITQLCGIDGTALFTAQHGGQKNPEAELVTLKIGVLVK